MTRRRDEVKGHQLDRVTTDKERTAFHAYCTCGVIAVRLTEHDAIAAINRHASNMALHHG
jgi:hypothetical protein